MADETADDVVELAQEDWDTVDGLIDKVFRVMNRDLTEDDKAVPNQIFVKVAEKAGYNSRQIRRRLADRDDCYKVRFNAPDRQTPVHCWHQGNPNDPPTEYVPRRPEKVRINGRLRSISPDSRYRLNKRQWWGSELIRAAEAGDVS